MSRSRLFVDLIQEASDCFGNWTPNQAITVGDYGVVNPQTAEFEKEGSIYDFDFAPEIHDEINKKHGIQACPTEDQLIVVSRGCKDQAFTAEFKNVRTIPKIVGSNIKGRWSFSRGRGAIVFLHQPTEWIIRDKARLFPRIQFNETLEGKALITSVYTCPRFALLLTDNAAEQADVAIGLSVMNIAGASVSGTWHHYSTSGLWRSGGQEGGLTFHPLYTLRTPKTKSWLKRVLGRRGETEPEGENTFLQYQPPWNVLDDEGNEISPESPQLNQGETLDF
ncbi:hypothetical protein D9758_005892 [Tetrapyrgos nigripes]|uniref:Uncharacterized protein n=1 Tax=Tetrapyrgos nigripes TaxID=182062 RepID=A0A8H5G2Q7_9AGAR|nr:hypothetical protein D9758_005892 [Tetrapyrgos nigripes]